MAEFILRCVWVMRHARALLQTRLPGQSILSGEIMYHRAFPDVWFSPVMHISATDVNNFYISLHATFRRIQSDVNDSVWVKWSGDLYIPASTGSDDEDIPAGNGWREDVKEYKRSEFDVVYAAKTWNRKEFLRTERSNGEVHLRIQLNLFQMKGLIMSHNLLHAVLKNDEASFCYVEITANDNTWKINERILVASSPFFARRIEFEAKRRTRSAVDLKNKFSNVAVDAFVKAINYESWDFQTSVVLTADLLELAEKFEFADLKAFCEEAFLQLATESDESFIDVVIIAYQRQSVVLKSGCISDLSDRLEFMDSDAWKKFKANDDTKALALEIATGVIQELHKRKERCLDQLFRTMAG